MLLRLLKDDCIPANGSLRFLNSRQCIPYNLSGWQAEGEMKVHRTWYLNNSTKPVLHSWSFPLKFKKNGLENSIHLLKQRFTEGKEKYFFKENNFGEIHISYFPFFFYRTWIFTLSSPLNLIHFNQLSLSFLSWFISALAPLCSSL